MWERVLYTWMSFQTILLGLSYTVVLKNNETNSLAQTSAPWDVCMRDWWRCMYHRLVNCTQGQLYLYLHPPQHNTCWPQAVEHTSGRHLEKRTPASSTSCKHLTNSLPALTCHFHNVRLTSFRPVATVARQLQMFQVFKLVTHAR